MLRQLVSITTLVLLAPVAIAAQGGAPDISGVWEADTPDGPQRVIIRPDSSASFGDETVQWRVGSDTLYILFGDEWIGYNFVVDGKEMTLSGGDLEEPITIRRIGPAPSIGVRRGSDPFGGR